MEEAVFYLFKTRKQMKIKFHIILSDQINLFLVLFFLGIFNIIFPIYSTQYTYILCIICLYVAVLGVVLISKKLKSIINQYIFFWLSLCVFSVGQSYVYIFDKNHEGFFLFSMYPPELINKYLIYAILSFVFVLAAANKVINVNKRRSCQFREDNSCVKDKISNELDYVDKFVFGSLWCFSLPFYFIDLSKNLVTSLQSGYRAIYEAESGGGILSMWFIPASFALLIAYRHSKIKYFFSLVLCLAASAYLVVGLRGSFFSIILSFIFIWDSAVKKISRKQLVGLILLGVIALALISVVGALRGSANRQFDDYLAALTSNGLLKSIGDSLVSLGGTMQVWLRLQHLVPFPYPFALGFSYLASILACIPSVLLGGQSFAEYAHLSGWITDVEGESYGLGFSMFGETFYNFGWLGPFVGYFICLIIFFVMQGSFRFDKKGRYKLFISSATLYYFILLARSSMYLSIRNIVYCVFIPILLCRLIKSFLARTAHENLGV